MEDMVLVAEEVPEEMAVVEVVDIQEVVEVVPITEVVEVGAMSIQLML